MRGVRSGPLGTPASVQTSFRRTDGWVSTRLHGRVKSLGASSRVEKDMTNLFGSHTRASGQGPSLVLVRPNTCGSSKRVRVVSLFSME